MTETQLEVKIKTALSDYIPNNVVSMVMSEAMAEIGSAKFSPEAYALAEKIQATLSEDDIKTAVTALTEFVPADIAEKRISEILITDAFPFRPQDTCLAGSTDVGDVSYIVPTAQLQAVTAAIGTPFHSWQMTAQTKSAVAYDGMAYAAKVMALTAVKLFENPQLLLCARDELNKKTGGVYKCPIPKDVIPTP